MSNDTNAPGIEGETVYVGYDNLDYLVEWIEDNVDTFAGVEAAKSVAVEKVVIETADGNELTFAPRDVMKMVIVNE